MNKGVIIDLTDDKYKTIFTDDVKIDLNGFEKADILVKAEWFKNIDKTITIITNKEVLKIKTKSIWNNSGKDRVLTVRNGKADFKNI